MLAAQRTFVFLDQQRGLVSHFAEFPQTFRLLYINNRSQVQFARADVGVINATQAKVFKHLCEVGHVCGQFFWRDSRVFDDTNRLGITFHARKQTQTRLAQTPNLADFRSVNP